MSRRLALVIVATIALAGRSAAQGGLDLSSIQIPPGFLDLRDVTVTTRSDGTLTATAYTTLLNASSFVLVSSLPPTTGRRGIIIGLKPDDWVVSFQSRVGPLEWVKPATDAVILQAAKDKRALVVYPIAFVSEHSETLVELDIEYRHLAEQNGAAAYVRVPAVGTHPAFIGGLANLVTAALSRDAAVQPGSGQHHCDSWRRCACSRGGSTPSCSA